MPQRYLIASAPLDGGKVKLTFITASDEIMAAEELDRRIERGEFVSLTPDAPIASALRRLMAEK
jgi:hypothetical protein